MGTEEMAHVSCLLCTKRTWFCILGTHVKVRYSGMCGNPSRGGQRQMNLWNSLACRSMELMDFRISENLSPPPKKKKLRWRATEEDASMSTCKDLHTCVHTTNTRTHTDPTSLHFSSYNIGILSKLQYRHLLDIRQSQYQIYKFQCSFRGGHRVASPSDLLHTPRSHVTKVHITPLHPQLHSFYSQCRRKSLSPFKLFSNSFADTTNLETWRAGGDRRSLEAAIWLSCHYHLPRHGQDPVSSASSGWSHYLGICTPPSAPHTHCQLLQPSGDLRITCPERNPHSLAAPTTDPNLLNKPDAESDGHHETPYKPVCTDQRAQ